jgi:hypothetical protein
VTLRGTATILTAIAFVLALSPPAFACPVCFGANDSPMATATNLGIIAMLVVVVGVLTAFASFFIYLMRRARLAARQSNAAAEAAGCLDTGGTAQW